MGKWLNRVIDKGKIQEIKYQYPPKSNTNNVDIVRELDVANPETKKTPKLDLLTEIELEAFNGWYATMRKPKFGMSHEEATLMAWRFLMESMDIMRRDGRGRYTSEN
jgi:hypothetical protein